MIKLVESPKQILVDKTRDALSEMNLILVEQTELHQEIAPLTRHIVSIGQRRGLAELAGGLLNEVKTRNYGDAFMNIERLENDQPMAGKYTVPFYTAFKNMNVANDYMKQAVIEAKLPKKNSYVRKIDALGKKINAEQEKLATIDELFDALPAINPERSSPRGASKGSASPSLASASYRSVPTETHSGNKFADSVGKPAPLARTNFRGRRKPAEVVGFPDKSGEKPEGHDTSPNDSGRRR